MDTLFGKIWIFALDGWYFILGFQGMVSNHNTHTGGNGPIYVQSELHQAVYIKPWWTIRSGQ